MVTAHNPILKGFYPDPSICRVGEDFYIVNSSFAYFPGVPIFHSKDLAHWEQIGNILDREEQLPLEGSEISRGIFAPTIRYHAGKYYMITTNVSNGGNFLVTADNPRGPWSERYLLGPKAQGIDPSLFFDDDGKCYYVGTRPNQEGVRYNGDWEIFVCELDVEKMEMVGEPMAIWKGALKDVIWPEGPHLYKIGEYYYLIHAEGGTGPEHAISVARSKELFKWFEGCPRNPIFTHRHLGMDYPIIYAGHGDLFDDGKGNYYIIMLASRQCKNHCSMGRETFLAKVEWENGWPVINRGIGKLTDTVEVDLPEFRFEEEMENHDTVHFYEDELDDRLVGIIKRNEKMYSLSANPGALRLFPLLNDLKDKEYNAFLGLRQKEYAFTAKTAVMFDPKNDNEAAGLVLYQNHANNLRMEIVKDNGNKIFRIVAHIKGEDNIISCYNIVKNGYNEIKIRANEQEASVWFNKEKVADEINLLPYSTEEAGGFVGCTVGMFVSSPENENGTYADFDFISVE